jgi:hypothetical protein
MDAIGPGLTRASKARIGEAGSSVTSPGSVRHSEDVEVKWALHPRGETRSEWVTGEVRTTLHRLISGRFRVQLPDEEVTLTEQGDYVMWGPGVDHSY